MKKKLVLLAAVVTGLLLAGCRVTVNGDSVTSPIWGLLVIGVGVWQYCNPESVFRFTEGWKYENLEPSEAGLDSIRWVGLLIMALGVVLLFNSCGAEEPKEPGVSFEYITSDLHTPAEELVKQAQNQNP